MFGHYSRKVLERTRVVCGQ